MLSAVNAYGYPLFYRFSPANSIQLGVECLSKVGIFLRLDCSIIELGIKGVPKWGNTRTGNSGGVL